MFFRRCPQAIFVALLLSSLPTRAQAPTPTPTPISEPITVDGVSVEERITVRSRALDSQTVTITGFDRHRIERSQSTTAAELVRESAGVHLIESGSLAGTSLVLTRGGDVNFTLVLLDGIPLNDPTDAQGGSFDLSTLDLDAITRVQVLRGPHSHFFGSSALAGAIDLTTRGGSGPAALRLRFDAGDDSLVHAGASISGGIGGESSESAFDGSDDDGAADVAEFPGYFVGAQYDRERHAVGDDSYRQLAIHGSVTVPVRDTSAVRVTGRATDLEADDYPEGSGGPVFGSGELRHSEGEQRSLGVTWGLDAGRWFHRGSAGGNRSQQDVESPAIEFSVPPSIEDRDYTRSQLSWTARRAFSWPENDTSVLSLGAQIDHERGETESTLFLPDFLGGEVAGDYRLSRTTPGAFAALEVNTAPLVIEAGVRADDPESLEVEWSPRVGVSSGVLSYFGILIHGSWSRAFKLPSFFALASPPALGGNPGLEPETSVGADAGLSWVGGQRGRNGANVTLFRSTYHDLIDFDFESFLHVNRSRVEAEGIELDGRIRVLDSLVVTAALTFQDVASSTGANVELHSPDHFGALSLEWSPIAALQLRIAGRVAGDTEDIQIPVPERTHVEGYELIDLAASWRVNDRFLIRARLDNATGEEYQHFLGFPQPGRRGRVGVEYDFR